MLLNLNASDNVKVDSTRCVSTYIVNYFNKINR